MSDRIVFTAVYGPYKPYKKHKQWTGDGKFIINNGTAVLVDEENGKELGRINLLPSDVPDEGKGFVLGNYECELQERYDEKINPFLGQPVAVSGVCKLSPPPSKPKPFVNPLLKDSEVRTVPLKASQVAKEPLYSVTDGHVLPRPPYPSKGETVVDVVIDPRLVKEMRQHQIVGVQFMYECIMGHREKIEGAILADEMGLGKTLQCIVLLYTLMKQGPENGRPIVNRALIVVPSTLVKNWRKEFKKWLGDERLPVFAVDGKGNTASQYYKIKDNWNGKVLIISYEQYSKNRDLLNGVSFDIMICDEGHRLKNQKTKTYTDLNGVDTLKRILLTGTPIQNDLTELYAIVEFVNPRLLGKFSRFQRLFIEPINASREPDAADDVKEHGRLQLSHLTETLDCFVLRRTSDTISKFLTNKIEYVVCCRLTSLQLEMYRAILGCSGVRKILLSVNLSANCHFAFISALRKLCNHPSLIKMQEEDETDDALATVNDSLNGILNESNEAQVPDEESCSGKLQVVLDILQSLRRESPSEKIVLVSNFTKTLDILSEACKRRSYKTCRLDGSTPLTKRQEIVDYFNSKSSDVFVFLLSTKAGGVGLNLIGASRLVLFDLDWNPAHDIQAMARIWRDGQKKTVHIYRLLTTGTIEEKIFQRQVMKQGLCTVVKDSSSNTKFSREELKELFTLSESSESTTHDSMNCVVCAKENSELNCSTTLMDVPVKKPNKFNIFNDDVLEVDPSKAMNMSQLNNWEHFGGEDLENLNSDCLNTSIRRKIVSFVFKNSFETQPNTDV